MTFEFHTPQLAAAQKSIRDFRRGNSLIPRSLLRSERSERWDSEFQEISLFFSFNDESYALRAIFVLSLLTFEFHTPQLAAEIANFRQFLYFRHCRILMAHFVRIDILL